MVNSYCRYGMIYDTETKTEKENRESSHIDENIQSAMSSGVKSTPTFFINEDRYDGAWDLDSLLAVLDQEGVFSWRQTNK